MFYTRKFDVCCKDSQNCLYVLYVKSELTVGIDRASKIFGELVVFPKDH